MMNRKKRSWFEFKLYVILYVIDQHRKTSAFGLSSELWGDISPMLDRMKQELTLEGVHYAGKPAQKEAVINSAIDRIATFYDKPVFLYKTS